MRRGRICSRASSVIAVSFFGFERSKLRPVLLLACSGRGDWIACQITSNPYSDPRAIMIADDAFSEGGLRRTSTVRPGKLFTANESLIATRAGSLKGLVLMRIRDAVVAIIREQN
jgi:mRNA interferase MazF